MIKKILITLVSLLTLSLGIYIVYEKTKENSNVYNLSNWMNYLLNADIQEISVTKSLSILFGAEEDYYEKATLTKEELKNVFNELNNYNLEKIYSDGIGFDGNDLTFAISYLVDDELHKFQIINGGYILGNNVDLELLKLFNSNNYTIHKDYETEHYYFKYVVDNNFSSVFEKYLDYYTNTQN